MLRRSTATTLPRCLEAGASPRHCLLCMHPVESYNLYSEDSLSSYEELFLYACPKFIAPNPPPYEDSDSLETYVAAAPTEPAQRHLQLFLTNVRAQLSVPTLRSFLKLYTSLDAAKLARCVVCLLDFPSPFLLPLFLLQKKKMVCNKISNLFRSFLDSDEEEMVQQMMVLKQASRSITRAPNAPSGADSLLSGHSISTSDLDFAIDVVCTP